MNDLSNRFAWAEKLSPKLLKSPWWIGHIPFAFELIGRLRPRTIVELGTYSGSSFAAFCQAAEACGAGTKCYGVDLWEGDIHMGSFDEALFREISEYMSANHRQTAVLVRKDFNAAVNDFADGSIDLLTSNYSFPSTTMAYVGIENMDGTRGVSGCSVASGMCTMTANNRVRFVPSP